MTRTHSRVLLVVVVAALVVAVAFVWRGTSDGGNRAGDPGTLLKPPAPPAVEAQQLAALPKGKLLPLPYGAEGV